MEAVVAAGWFDVVEDLLGGDDGAGGDVDDAAGECGQEQFGEQVGREVVDDEGGFDAVDEGVVGVQGADVVDEQVEVSPGGDAGGEGADLVE
ncbi:hypothetical protein V1227_07470 [Lentzea sp. DG1S-22]|nr:hypothetical protein [Lentzea sp. DG1S-22]WVH82585.1 hypothetical protein V1227_07470 [Lentzea sp. DG1S-22]